VEVNKIYTGNCLDIIKTFPDKSVNCIITSPPYWQLRNYGWDGQWGLEPTFQEYLENLWSLMDEIWRVLKDDGTVWVNLGDSYNGSGVNDGSKNPGISNLNKRECLNKRARTDLPAKCLMLLPHRFAIGCIDRGWIVRNDIKWLKPNGMPESVRDRFSKKSEYFFLMVKNEKYYFDLNGIREPHKEQSIQRALRAVGFTNKWINGADGQTAHNLSQPRPNKTTKIDKSTCEMFGSPRARYHRDRPDNLRSPKEALDNGEALHELGKNPGDVSHFWIEAKKPTIDEYLKLAIEHYYSESDDWEISTKPSSAKHYATFNSELIDKPIIAGCPEGGIILDAFCGTGTTLIRALQLNRKAIGIDGSQEYCEIAEKQLNNELDKLNLFCTA
jgi:site-specific DNA-methyltransferase (adenine-specific)